MTALQMLTDIYNIYTAVKPIVDVLTAAVTAASTAAALIPASQVSANPVLKVFTALIDVLAINMGHAKEGPTPAAVLKEVVTGTPSPQREEPKG